MAEKSRRRRERDTQEGHDTPYQGYNYYGEREGRSRHEDHRPLNAWERSREFVNRDEFTDEVDFDRQKMQRGSERDRQEMEGRSADYRDYNRYRVSPELRGEHYGVGPKGYQRSDARILEDINEHLTWDGDVNASEIDVRVENGEITLEGTVPNRQQKRLAEDIAYHVRGVREVHNRLRVAREGENTSGSNRG